VGKELSRQRSLNKLFMTSLFLNYEAKLRSLDMQLLSNNARHV